MKILMIEDDSAFAQMMFEFLTDSGFEVAAAPRGKDGLKMAASFHPDLILLDYHLSDMTGFDVATSLGYMRNTAAIPFLVVSSMMGDPLLTSSFKKFPNCRGTLLKTLSLGEILGEIKKVLNIL